MDGRRDRRLLSRCRIRLGGFTPTIDPQKGLTSITAATALRPSVVSGRSQTARKKGSLPEGSPKKRPKYGTLTSLPVAPSVGW
jgi:hypothetical protein